MAHDKRSEASLESAAGRTMTPRNAILAGEATLVRSLVGTLSMEEQLLIQLFFIDGLNATEVARTLNSGTSAVRMRKKRILEKLRLALQEHPRGTE